MEVGQLVVVKRDASLWRKKDTDGPQSSKDVTLLQGNEFCIVLDTPGNNLEVFVMSSKGMGYVAKHALQDWYNT